MNLRKPVYARGTRRRRVCHECSVAAQTRAETFESRLLLSAVTVRLSASRDTTIYDPVAGDVSNGSGQFIVTGGSAAQSDIHRGLIAFDLSTAGIPAGATVIDAALTMQVADSHGGVATVGLYRTLSAWGEGLSNAPGSELEGADAVQSDATWLFRFFDGTEILPL